MGLEGDALEAELAEFFPHNEEVAHVHAAGFEGGGHFLHRFGDGVEGLGVEGREAGSEQGHPAQGGGEGVFDLEFRGAEPSAGFVTDGCAFFDEAFLLIPDRKRNRNGESEEVVGAEPFGFVHVLIVGVLDAEADAFPSLRTGESDFDAGFFLFESEEVHIRAVDGLRRGRCAEFFNCALERAGEFEGFIRAEAEEGFQFQECEVLGEAGRVEFVGDSSLVHEREAFLGEAPLTGGEAFLSEG